MTKYIINIHLPKQTTDMEVEINVTFQDDNTDLAKQLDESTTTLQQAVEANSQS